MEQNLTLTQESNGDLVYDSSAYFPLDDFGYGVCGGGGLCDVKEASPGNWHNFFFTSEIHIEFTYLGGEVFQFEGDDDVWVFINRKLVVDVGGVHVAISQSVALDSLTPSLTLSDTYPLDIYHAERQTAESNFKMTTSIKIASCPPGTVSSSPPPPGGLVRTADVTADGTAAQPSAAKDGARAPSAVSAGLSAAVGKVVSAPVTAGSVTPVTIGAVVTLFALGLYKKRRAASADVAPSGRESVATDDNDAVSVDDVTVLR